MAFNRLVEDHRAELEELRQFKAQHTTATTTSATSPVTTPPLNASVTPTRGGDEVVNTPSPPESVVGKTKAIFSDYRHRFDAGLQGFQHLHNTLGSSRATDTGPHGEGDSGETNKQEDRTSSMSFAQMTRDLFTTRTNELEVNQQRLEQSQINKIIFRFC